MVNILSETPVTKNKSWRLFVFFDLLPVWALSITILLGLIRGELLGSFAFGLILSSALTNIVLFCCYFRSEKRMWLVKGEWIGLGILLLGFVLFGFSGKNNSDNSDIVTVLFWTTLVHAFPVSIVINIVYGWVSYLLYARLSLVQEVSYAYIIITWIVFFAFGYIQWFNVIPWFVKRGRSRKHR